MTVSSVSVLICTYNRMHLLRETLAALQALEKPSHCDLEIVVIDNNSTDGTAAVIAAAAASSSIPIRSAHEPRQGKSFALNTGLSLARGDVIALTDDDVWVSPDWIVCIVADFRERDVAFVFGKVLPRWSRLPPPEILTQPAQAIWGPLAIVDYGDEPADYTPQSAGQRLPIGANLAVTREALVRVGGWRTDLGKVNNTLISGEDHEIFSRLRRHGLYAGYYDPTVTVRHFVPASRLTRAYFRRWFFWNGKTHARMLGELHPELDIARVPRIGGVPRFLYRQSLSQLLRWARAVVAADALTVLTEELRVAQHAGMLYECWRSRRVQPT